MNGSFDDSVPLGSGSSQNQVDDSVPLGSRPLRGAGGTRNQVTSRGGPKNGTRSGTRSGNQVEENPRDTWCTPAWLAEALGRWDLDPCSNSRSHIRATVALSLEQGDDGLTHGKSIHEETRTFVNPPYSRGQVALWVDAYAHTRFCFLVRLDPSTAWFRALYAKSALVAMPRRRIHFEPPPGVGVKGGPFSSVRFPHALFYAREEDATPAILRACFAWRTKSHG